jgi:hypothetical protein
MKRVIGIGAAALAAIVGIGACAAGPAAAQAKPGTAVSSDQVVRVPVAEARQRVQAGRALFVCAYDSDAKYASMKLERSISWSELQAKLPSLDKRQEIILYCG